MLLIKSIKLHTLFAKTQDILNAANRHAHALTCGCGRWKRAAQPLLLRSQTAPWTPGGMLAGRSGDEGAGITLPSGSLVAIPATFTGPRPAFCSGLCPRWTGDPGVQQGVMGWFPWRQRVEAPLSGWECWAAWLQPPAISAPSAFHG